MRSLFTATNSGFVLLLILFPLLGITTGFREDYDICVYTGNAAGVMAAYQAAKQGANVILIEPSRWLGGMTGGGIDTLDWGEDDIIGGHTRLILQNKYDNKQYREAFKHLMDSSENVTILFEHRVNGVYMNGNEIRQIVLDLAPYDKLGCPPPNAKVVNNHVISARTFIDCSYEGELMAQTKSVKYTFGRESRDTYGESLAGIEVLRHNHNLLCSTS